MNSGESFIVTLSDLCGKVSADIPNVNTHSQAFLAFLLGSTHLCIDMRIDPKEYQKYDWEAHHLCADFRVEDVWRLPVTLKPEHNLNEILEQFWNASAEIELKGLAGWLFRVRFFVGRIFGWDEKETHITLVPGSIRERYAQKKGLTFEQLPNPGKGSFVPVYNLEQESLSEIENATVHAAIHLGRVPIEDNKFTVNMTIYVKPKGTFGNLYMLLIKPFRLLIVYPALLRMIKRRWEHHQDKKKTSVDLYDT